MTAIPIAFVACVMLAACGGGSSGIGTTASAVGSPPYTIISASRVASEPPGSPQRALLSWWRFMQFRSASDALHLFTPSLQGTLEHAPSYPLEVYNYFGPWLAHVDPTIIDTETQGHQATVYIRARVSQASGASISQAGDAYIGIALARGSAGWQLSDDSFFEGQVAALEPSPSAHT